MNPSAVALHRVGLREIAYVLAGLYLLVALAAMWLHSPRVPYADGWRYIAVLADAPFMDGVLMVSNGHREVLPNTVRWLDLRLFGASQHLQILTGIMLLLATVLALWHAGRTIATPARAVAMLWATIGLCWLGNARALVHAQESVHAYLVTLALVCGAGLLAISPRGARDAWVRGLLAGGCGLIATFSFGSGIACFGAFLVVLWLRRAPLRDVWPVLTCGLLATALLLGAGVGEERVAFAPLTQIERLLRWLAAPSLYAAWPLLDPAIAARLPVAQVRALVMPLAEGVIAVTGPTLLARWPHLLTGTLGAIWLMIASIRCRRAPVRAAVVGLGVAWFAVGVGGLIALARLGYFDLYPDQLLASRYVVWSSLFWTGLVFASLSGERTTWQPAVALFLAVLLLPSQLWMWRYAERIQQVATPIATAAAVGVLDPSAPLGENVVTEIRSSLAPLKARGAAMYAWPEAHWLGRPFNAEAVEIITTDPMTISVFDNQLFPGEQARWVEFPIPKALAGRWLLQDQDGIVRGLATAEPGNDGRAVGWMRGHHTGKPRVLVLLKAGGG